MALDYQKAEQWFPLYIRFLGSILGAALVVATILGYAGVEFAGAYAFVTGMILYKSVHDYVGRERAKDGVSVADEA